MAKFVYLLGAGASSQALPMVGEIKEFLKAFVGAYGRADYLTTAMNSMLKELVLFPSPDVYATSLSNTENPKFNHFNNMISMAFFWKQNFPNLHEHHGHLPGIGDKFQYEIDPRYLGFFTSLIDRSTKKLIPELGIISWNYDMQIEGALKMLGLKEMPQIVRLNGIARASTPEGKLIETIQDYKDSRDNILELKSEIRYGWDDQSQNQSDLESILDDTEVLTIIGYSFPDYNRFADEKIFQFLGKRSRHGGSLPKIKLVGRSQGTLDKIERSIKEIIAKFNWSNDKTKRIEPSVEKVISEDKFLIPREIPIFGRQS